MARFFNRNNANQYYQNMPELQALQLNADGTVQVVDNVPDMQPVRLRDRLANALFGVQSTPTDGVLNLNTGEITGKDAFTGEDVTFNPTTSSTISSNPRVGGLLNDLASGYRENYDNRFRVGNWGDNELPFDRNKGFGYRLGEGLGTLGRFIDSPLGRGVLAAGLNSTLGYNRSLQEGLNAAVGRQNAQTQDRLYRQQLAEQGIDTSDIGGNIDNSIYRQILYGQQLQDNAEYRKLYLDNQQRQNEIMNQLRQDQLARQERQDAIQNQIAFGNLGVAQARTGAYIKYLQDKENKTTQDKTALKVLSENQQTLADIDAGLQLIKENPQAYTWFKGKIGADAANRLDPKGVPTRTQIDNITAVYRKWLTGAQMSDAERKAYERFLPAPTDNAQIVESKLQGMKNSIERKNQIIMQNMNVGQQVVDDNPLGLNL